MTARQPPSLGYHEITALLPHRYPFQFVDRVLEFEDGKRIVALKNVTINEPFFRGHFPQQPLMPGVLICETMAQASAILIRSSTDSVQDGNVVILTGLDGVRFRRPVLPGDQLHIEVTLAKRRRFLWKMQGIARVEGRIAAEAELSLTETASRQL
jgi:3-hydroxyacyl-[acyl-carrier-protein] dehydratase